MTNCYILSIYCSKSFRISSAIKNTFEFYGSVTKLVYAYFTNIFTVLHIEIISHLMEVVFVGLKAAHFEKPTEIQRQSIGLALRELDILGAAKTGSGKTLAFLIPVTTNLKLQLVVSCLDLLCYTYYSNNIIYLDYFADVIFVLIINWLFQPKQIFATININC